MPFAPSSFLLLIVLSQEHAIQAARQVALGPWHARARAWARACALVREGERSAAGMDLVNGLAVIFLMQERYNKDPTPLPLVTYGTFAMPSLQSL